MTPAAVCRSTDDAACVEAAVWRLRRSLVHDPAPSPLPVGLVGAWGADGRPLYLYPEVGGYWLRWAASRDDVDERHGEAVVRTLANYIEPGLGLPTRIPLDHQTPAHAGARYLFDHAMLHDGLLQWACWRNCAVSRQLAVNLEQPLSGFFTRGRIEAARGLPEGGWSARSGPFLLKALARLGDLAGALGVDVQAHWPRLLAEALDLPHHQAHPQLYAVEGLLELGELTAAKQAFERLLRRHGGLESMREQPGSGPRRHDVLAQCLRLAVLLGPNECDPGELAAAARELAAGVDERGTLPFAAGRPERPSWAAIFAEQALAAWLGEEFRCLV